MRAVSYFINNNFTNIMKNFVTLAEKWEEDKYTPKTASTLFQNGGFISLLSGGAIPSTPGIPILGVGMEDVAASDVDYTSTRQIAYQTSYNNYFNVNVGAGTAIASMVGSTFNLFNAETIDLTSYSTITYNTLAVSTFAIGHTITGGTSGATGVITRVNTIGGSQQITFTVTAGTFVAGETITDGTSSATAKILTVFIGGVQLEVVTVISTTQVVAKVKLIA